MLKRIMTTNAPKATTLIGAVYARLSRKQPADAAKQ
jgi:hypothetical protein